VTEVCTNIVRHGYGDTPAGDITVSAAREPESIRLTIEDDAPVYVPEKSARPPAPASLAEGGYGLSLVQRLADEVRHEPLGDRGNRTILIKRHRH
jgi:anti-sigma regulatory factor (Ser/Thr protein kinase)